MEIKRIPQLPQLVALDTDVFDSYNFNYQSKSFQTLVKLVQQKRIRLLLTSVNLQEIRAHITKEAESPSKALAQAIKDLKKNRFTTLGDNNSKISTNSDVLKEFKKKVEDRSFIFEKINQELQKQLDSFLQDTDMFFSFEKINQELQNQLNSFLQDTEFKRIEVDQVSVVEIFENYFAGNPPFGEGNKKSEFPDAFALLALEKEAKYRNEIIYVVSADRDWEKFCSSRSEDLRYIKKLNELLEIISRETDSYEVDVCYQLYRQKEDQIKRDIQDNFSNLDFSIDLSDTIFIESGSETIKIVVDSVNITGASLVYINNSNVEQPSVLFNLEVKVNYDATVSYESLESGIFYGQYYVNETETINTVFPQSLNFNVEVTLTLYRDKNDCLHDADRTKINIDPNNILHEIVVDKILENYHE